MFQLFIFSEILFLFPDPLFKNLVELIMKNISVSTICDKIRHEQYVTFLIWYSVFCCIFKTQMYLKIPSSFLFSHVSCFYCNAFPYIHLRIYYNQFLLYIVGDGCLMKNSRCKHLGAVIFYYKFGQ